MDEKPQINGDDIPSEEPRGDVLDYLGLLVYEREMAVVVKKDDELPV
jgi:hypothetical protein